MNGITTVNTTLNTHYYFSCEGSRDERDSQVRMAVFHFSLCHCFCKEWGRNSNRVSLCGAEEGSAGSIVVIDISCSSLSL